MRNRVSVRSRHKLSRRCDRKYPVITSVLLCALTAAALVAGGCAATSSSESTASKPSSERTSYDAGLTTSAASTTPTPSVIREPSAAGGEREEQASEKQKKSDIPSGDVPAAIKQAFGQQVEAVTQFKPHHLLGDFNADGIQDLFAIVRLRAPKSELPKDVAVSNPFARDDEERLSKDHSAEASTKPVLAFAIIHGAQSGGWSGSHPQAKYLLLDTQSPVLALDAGRLDPKASGAAAKLIELLPVREQRNRVASFGVELTAIEGDGVIAGTEAVDSLIYFDGTTYKWREEIEEP